MVGMVVSKNIVENVINFVLVAEWFILLQMDAWPKINIIILQVYASTTDHSKKEKEFYAQITALLRKLPKQDLTIITRDFNAKVGKGEYIRPWDLGERNGRGAAECVCGKT